MAFNVNSIKDAQSAQIELKNPETGELLGATITIAGPEHPIRKKITFARQREVFKGIQKTGKMQLLRDPEEDEIEGIDDLAKITLGWDGINDDSGAPMPFSVAKACELYTNLGWLRNQLFIAKNETERFITTSATA